MKDAETDEMRPGALNAEPERGELLDSLVCMALDDYISDVNASDSACVAYRALRCKLKERWKRPAKGKGMR